MELWRPRMLIRSGHAPNIGCVHVNVTHEKRQWQKHGYHDNGGEGGLAIVLFGFFDSVTGFLFE